MHTLKVQELQKVIKKTEIIKGVSLSVQSGEVVGLLGPNGAGKTTMFYMICGLIPPSAGAVYFDNQDVTQIPLHVRAKLGIGYLPQEASCPGYHGQDLPYGYLQQNPGYRMPAGPRRLLLLPQLLFCSLS